MTWRHRAARVLRRAAGVLERWTDRLEATAPAAMSLRPTDDADDAVGGERGGPPAHWLARVRDAGPGAMLGAELARATQATQATPVSPPTPVARASQSLVARSPVAAPVAPVAPGAPTAPPSPAATAGAMRLGRARPRREAPRAAARGPRADADPSRDAAASTIGPWSSPPPTALEWASPATRTGPGELAVSTRHAPAAGLDADASIPQPVAASRPLRLSGAITSSPHRRASAPVVAAAPAPMPAPATPPSHVSAPLPRLDRDRAATPVTMPARPDRGAAHTAEHQSPRAETSPHWRERGDAVRPAAQARRLTSSARGDAATEPRSAHGAPGPEADYAAASPAARIARPRQPRVRFSGGGRLPWPSLPEPAVEIDLDPAADALEIEHRARLAREQRGW